MNSTDELSSETLRRARLAWEQSVADLRNARHSLKQGGTLESSFFSLQAAVNALAVVPQLYGHFQLPTHSPTQLLALCRDVDNRFEALEAPCATLEAVQDQDPFRPGAREEDPQSASQRALDDAKAVHKAVREFLKDNRKRYFVP